MSVAGPASPPPAGQPPVTPSRPAGRPLPAPPTAPPPAGPSLAGPPQAHSPAGFPAYGLAAQLFVDKGLVQFIVAVH